MLVLTVWVGSCIWQGGKWVVSKFSGDKAENAAQQSVAPPASNPATGAEEAGDANASPAQGAEATEDVAEQSAAPPAGDPPPGSKEAEAASASSAQGAKVAEDATQKPMPAGETQPSAARQWQDKQGRTLDASFLGYRDGNVGLQTADGEEHWTPLIDLAKPDRQFVLQRVGRTEGSAPGHDRSTLQIRTWSDTTGNFQTEAAFVSVNDQGVELLKESGDIVIVPLDRLSDGDRNHLRGLLPAGP